MIPAFDFVPGRFFSKLFHSTGKGEDLWKWMWGDDNIANMKLASDAGKVAVTPLQLGLLDVFGDDFVRRDRIKQMIGRMTRQILEHCGYEWLGSGFKVKEGNLFNKGSKYGLSVK